MVKRGSREICREKEREEIKKELCSKTLVYARKALSMHSIERGVKMVGGLFFFLFFFSRCVKTCITRPASPCVFPTNWE